MSDKNSLVRRFIETLEGRDWASFSELLTPEVVYELPQTRERIRGRDAYVEFNREYPGDWHLRLKVVISDDANGVAWFDWRVGPGESGDGVAFFSFEGDRISKVTDFWPEPYDPPVGREHLVERW
jgi:hypothetical protein